MVNNSEVMMVWTPHSRNALKDTSVGGWSVGHGLPVQVAAGGKGPHRDGVPEHFCFRRGALQEAWRPAENVLRLEARPLRSAPQERYGRQRTRV